MSEPILFKPGEKAQFFCPLRHPPSAAHLLRVAQKRLHYGQTVTIVKLSSYKDDYWAGPWYFIREGDYPIAVVHQALRRIDPIHDAAGSWKSCLWVPKSLQKQVSYASTKERVNATERTA